MPSQSAYLGCLVAAAVLGGVSGHGYVKSPVSRAYGCSSGGGRLNQNCGQVQYEPQSVEGPDGWPSGGPAAGEVASAGSPAIQALNAQSATRWGKVAMSAGTTPFTWRFTAAHVTRDFRYFITRVGWDANRPLDASSFEEAPFCTLDYGMKQPPAELTHDCTVPSREGYHVVLAIWDVGDTPASFYNAIDVVFQNGGEPTPTPPPQPATPTPQATPVPEPVPTTPPAQTPTPTTTPAPSVTLTPQPVSSPSPSGCAKELQVWNACKSAPGCCAAGLTCYRLSAWYAQCRKSCTKAAWWPCEVLGGDAHTPAPLPATPVPPAPTTSPPPTTPPAPVPTPTTKVVGPVPAPQTQPHSKSG